MLQILFHVYKEPANPHDESAVAVIDSGPHSEVIYRSYGILLHEGALSSVISLEGGGKEKLRSTMLMHLLLWIFKRPSNYLRPGIYFCRNAVFPTTKAFTRPAMI